MSFASHPSEPQEDIPSKVLLWLKGTTLWDTYVVSELRKQNGRSWLARNRKFAGSKRSITTTTTTQSVFSGGVSPRRPLSPSLDMTLNGGAAQEAVEAVSGEILRSPNFSSADPTMEEPSLTGDEPQILIDDKTLEDEAPRGAITDLLLMGVYSGELVLSAVGEEVQGIAAAMAASATTKKGNRHVSDAEFLVSDEGGAYRQANWQRYASALYEFGVEMSMLGFKQVLLGHRSALIEMLVVLYYLHNKHEDTQQTSPSTDDEQLPALGTEDPTELAQTILSAAATLDETLLASATTIEEYLRRLRVITGHRHSSEAHKASRRPSVDDPSNGMHPSASMPSVGEATGLFLPLNSGPMVPFGSRPLALPEGAIDPNSVLASVDQARRRASSCEPILTAKQCQMVTAFGPPFSSGPLTTVEHNHLVLKEFVKKSLGGGNAAAKGRSPDFSSPALNNDDGIITVLGGTTALSGLGFGARLSPKGSSADLSDAAGTMTNPLSISATINNDTIVVTDTDGLEADATYSDLPATASTNPDGLYFEGRYSNFSVFKAIAAAAILEQIAEPGTRFQCQFAAAVLLKDVCLTFGLPKVFYWLVINPTNDHKITEIQDGIVNLIISVETNADIHDFLLYLLVAMSSPDRLVVMIENIFRPRLDSQQLIALSTMLLQVPGESVNNAVRWIIFLCGSLLDPSVGARDEKWQPADVATAQAKTQGLQHMSWVHIAQGAVGVTEYVPPASASQVGSPSRPSPETDFHAQVGTPNHRNQMRQHRDDILGRSGRQDSQWEGYYSPSRDRDTDASARASSEPTAFDATNASFYNATSGTFTSPFRHPNRRLSVGTLATFKQSVDGNPSLYADALCLLLHIFADYYEGPACMDGLLEMIAPEVVLFIQNEGSGLLASHPSVIMELMGAAFTAPHLLMQVFAEATVSSELFSDDDLRRDQLEALLAMIFSFPHVDIAPLSEALLVLGFGPQLAEVIPTEEIVSEVECMLLSELSASVHCYHLRYEDQVNQIESIRRFINPAPAPQQAKQPAGKKLAAMKAPPAPLKVTDRERYLLSNAKRIAKQLTCVAAALLEFVVKQTADGERHLVQLADFTANDEGEIQLLSARREKNAAGLSAPTPRAARDPVHDLQVVLRRTLGRYVSDRCFSDWVLSITAQVLCQQNVLAPPTVANNEREQKKRLSQNKRQSGIVDQPARLDGVPDPLVFPFAVNDINDTDSPVAEAAVTPKKKKGSEAPPLPFFPATSGHSSEGSGEPSSPSQEPYMDIVKRILANEDGVLLNISQASCATVGLMYRAIQDSSRGVELLILVRHAAVGLMLLESERCVTASPKLKDGKLAFEQSITMAKADAQQFGDLLEKEPSVGGSALNRKRNSNTLSTATFAASVSCSFPIVDKLGGALRSIIWLCQEMGMELPTAEEVNAASSSANLLQQAKKDQSQGLFGCLPTFLPRIGANAHQSSDRQEQSASSDWSTVLFTGGGYIESLQQDITRERFTYTSLVRAHRQTHDVDCEVCNLFDLDGGKAPLTNRTNASSSALLTGRSPRGKKQKVGIAALAMPVTTESPRQHPILSARSGAGTSRTAPSQTGSESSSARGLVARKGPPEIPMLNTTKMRVGDRKKLEKWVHSILDEILLKVVKTGKRGSQNSLHHGQEGSSTERQRQLATLRSIQQRQKASASQEQYDHSHSASHLVTFRSVEEPSLEGIQHDEHGFRRQIVAMELKSLVALVRGHQQAARQAADLWLAAMGGADLLDSMDGEPNSNTYSSGSGSSRTHGGSASYSYSRQYSPSFGPALQTVRAPDGSMSAMSTARVNRRQPLPLAANQREVLEKRQMFMKNQQQIMERFSNEQKKTSNVKPPLPAAARPTKAKESQSAGVSPSAEVLGPLAKHRAPREGVPSAFTELSTSVGSPRKVNNTKQGGVTPTLPPLRTSPMTVATHPNSAPPTTDSFSKKEAKAKRDNADRQPNYQLKPVISPQRARDGEGPRRSLDGLGMSHSAYGGTELNALGVAQQFRNALVDNKGTHQLLGKGVNEDPNKHRQVLSPAKKSSPSPTKVGGKRAEPENPLWNTPARKPLPGK